MPMCGKNLKETGVIRGHTKNSADRHFNLLKLQYHKRNIFTYDQLCEALDNNEYATVHKMHPADFKNNIKFIIL